MTKLRPPLTFPDAITRIAGLIGYAEMARIVGHTDRTVRYWSEADCDTLPRLSHAKALDRAWRAAGGDGFPILESYALQIEADIAEALACHADLARDIAALATENADAIATAIVVTQPGATATDVHRAIAEAEEGCRAGSRLLGRLKSFLARKPAGEAEPGVQP